MGSWNGRLRAVLHVVAIAIIGIKTVSAGWAQSEVKEAAEYGIKKMNELVEIYEPQLYKKGIWIQRGDPAHYVAAFNSQSEEAKRLATFGYASLQASSRLVSNFPGGRSAIHKFPTVSLLNTPLYDQCPLRDSPRCPHYNDRYRTYDGRCNNPAHPWWGATLMPLHRFLPPNYRDGLERIRESVSGGSLPSARAVSYSIHGDRDSDLSTITHMVMQWGQFLDHDLTASAQTRGFNGSVPRCCWDGGKDFLPQDLTHPDCMPIAVPPDDPFYDHYGVRCLEFVRSSPTSRVGCSLGPRDQINQVTSFIDGSVIYGSSDREAEHLRLFRNGLLKYSRVQYRLPLLPGADHVADLCRGSSGHLKCFHAGDKRVNEQPALIAMHTLWLRVHNRVATELSHLNPHWKDEKIYQEARRIVAALLQHITYKEFLPLILGPDVVQMFDLDLMRKGYYNGYDIQINPTAANAFGSAAFRFGHSLVQRSLVRCDRSHNQLYSNVSLHEELTNPSNMYNIGSVDRLLLGLCMQPSQKRDEFITRELTNHLFQTQRFHYGMDLAALNIQRGRDHGIAPYNAWRGPCGLRPLNDWQDLLKVMSPDTQRRLKRVYRDVDDIDLFTGGMVERPVVGGLVGPTFACIIAQQFSNLRKGDRFWYENGGFESSFTPAQLQQIRRVTLARIMCDNLDTIDTIQPFVFLTPDEYRNERVRCDSNRILSFDLRPWTERLEQNNNYPPPDRYPEHGRPESPQKPDNENSPNYPVDHDHHYHPDVTPTYLIDDKFQSTRPPKPDDDIRPSYLIDDKYQQTRPPSHSYTTTKRPHYGGSDYNKPSYNQHHKEEEFKEKPRPIKPVYPAPDIEVITNFPSIPVSQGSPSKPHKDKYSESSHHYNKPHQENSYENKPSNQNHKPHDNSHHHTSDYIVPHKEDSYQKPSNANHKPNDHYRPPSDYNVPHTEDTYLKPPHDHHHSTSEYGIPHEEDSYIKPPQNNHKPHDDHHSTSNYDIPHQEDTYLKPPSNHHKPHNHYHPTSEYNVPHNEDSYLKPPQDHHQKPHDHHHPTSDYNIPLEEDSYTKPSQSHDHGHDDSYVKPQKPHHHNEFDTDNNVDSYIPQHEHHHKPQDHYTKPQKPQQEVKPYPSYYEEYTLTDSVRPTKKPPQHHGNSKPNKFSEHFNEPSYYYFTSNEDSHNLLKIGSLLIPENETLQDLQNLKNMVKLPVKMGNMTFSVGVKTSLHLGSANSTKGTGLWSFDISDVDEVELPEVPTLPVDPQAIQELPHPIAVLQEEQDTGSRGLD